MLRALAAIGGGAEVRLRLVGAVKPQYDRRERRAHGVEDWASAGGPAEPSNRAILDADVCLSSAGATGGSGRWCGPSPRKPP